MTKDEVKYEALELSLAGNLITVTEIKQSARVIFHLGPMLRISLQC